MKKIFAFMLVLMLAFSACAAYAAEIMPLMDVDMQNIDNCTLSVSFDISDVSDKGIIATVYDDVRYDAIEVSQIAVGDTINYMGEDVTVESVDVDYSTFINGGSENDGIVLCPDEGGTYIALNYESQVYMPLGQAEFAFADEVTYSHWKQEAGGGISDEMDVRQLAAADVKAALEEEGSGTFWYDCMTVRLENGVIVEVAVNYVP